MAGTHEAGTPLSPGGDKTWKPPGPDAPGRRARARRRFQWDTPQKIVATLAAVVAIIGGVGGAVAWVVSLQPPDPTVREIQPQQPAASRPVASARITYPASVAMGYGWSKGGVNSRNAFVAVTATMDPAPSCNGGGAGWVFAQNAAALAPLAWAEQQAKEDDWARVNGGVPVAGNHIQLTLQELNGEAFIIDSITARVTHRAKPNIKTFPELSGGCGGITQSFFAVNLDEGDNPQATPVSAPGLPPIPLPHKLDAQDQFETWNVIVNTNNCDCEFILAFNYTAAGQQHTYDVSLHNGKSWRVSAAPGVRPIDRDTNGAWPDPTTPMSGKSTSPAY